MLSAPNRAIWLRLRFVIRIANRKSLSGRAQGDEPKGTNRAQTQIFADSRLFLQILAFSWKTKQLRNADFRRKPQIFAGSRRKLQEPAENRRLAFVPLGSSP